METENAQPSLGELARRQWGVVTREQLVERGMRTRGISDWVQSGRLHRLYRGIYAYGHDRLRIEGCWLAAVMACGPGAVLSHRDAARLWELRQSNSALIDVTVPSRNGRVRRTGIRVHRSGRISVEEVTERSGIPVTTVARTLLDLADVLTPQALQRAVTEAEYRDRFDLTAIDAVVQANPGRRGRKLMTAAVGKRHRTRSPLEDRFLAFKARWGVEEPESGVWIDDYEVDFLWTRVGLAVELDGVAAHGTRRAVNADRLRDRVLWRRGIRTMRLTSEALDDPEAVLTDLVQAAVRVESWPRASSYSPPRRASISSASAT
jgi:predicted transcriptional regulator of viral defense system